MLREAHGCEARDQTIAQNHLQDWAQVLADTCFFTQIPHVDLGQGARALSLPPGRHWGSS